MKRVSLEMIVLDLGLGAFDSRLDLRYEGRNLEMKGTPAEIIASSNLSGPNGYGPRSPAFTPLNQKYYTHIR